jgi:hypothetical protein
VALFLSLSVEEDLVDLLERRRVKGSYSQLGADCAPPDDSSWCPISGEGSDRPFRSSSLSSELNATGGTTLADLSQ